MAIGQRQYSKNKVFYVSELPGQGGADWGYTDRPNQAIELSKYWQRRFVADMRRVGSPVQITDVPGIKKNPRVPVSMKLWKWDKTIGYWMLEKVITEPGTAQQWLAIHQLDEPTTPYKLSRSKPRTKPTKNAHNFIKINPRNDINKRAHNWEAYRDALVLAITAPTDAQSDRAAKLAENFASTMTIKEQEQAKRYAQKIVKRETGSHPRKTRAYHQMATMTAGLKPPTRKKAKRRFFVELCGTRSGICYLTADANLMTTTALKDTAMRLSKQYREPITAKRKR